MPETTEIVVYDIHVTPLENILLGRLPDWAFVKEKVANVLSLDGDPRIDEAWEILDHYQWEYVLSRFIESEFAIRGLKIRITRNSENGDYTITHQWMGKKCPILFHFSEAEINKNESYERDEINMYLPVNILKKLGAIIEKALWEKIPKNIDDSIRDILKKEIKKGLKKWPRNEAIKESEMNIRISYLEKEEKEWVSISKQIITSLT